jgi:parallel beta-helix repeat protein
MNRTILIFLLGLLVVNAFAFALGVQPARAEGFVVPDDYPTIQSAINAVGGYVRIFVRNGTYYENLVVNRTVYLIGENKDATIIDGSKNANSRAVVDITAPWDGIVTDLTIRNGNCGILIENPIAFNWTVADDKVINNSEGICVMSNFPHEVADNEVENNVEGILLQTTQGNLVHENNVTSNVDGIVLQNAQANLVCKNNITSNEGAGVVFDEAQNNSIFHNTTFWNNTVQARASTSPGFKNLLDNGYPSGGNYWSDLNATDFYSGPYQNETGSDGIADASYSVDSTESDRYPLMYPWTMPHIEILNSALSKTVVGKGANVTFTVNITNKVRKVQAFTADVIRSLDFSSFYDSRKGTVPMSGSTILSFEWNTSKLAYGNYTITTNLWPADEAAGGRLQAELADSNYSRRR